MATPDTRHSLVVTKQFTYRGATRTFSNRYHFEGDLPTNPTQWEALADNVTDAEKDIYPNSVEIIQATGYDAGTATSTNPHGDAVFTKTYTKVGDFVPAAGEREAPGDCCALLRYSTPARSSKNHPVYLFNYLHGAVIDTAVVDKLSPTQRTAIEGYGADWVTGFSDGSTNRERCGPRGAVSTAHTVDQYVRHRDFPA